VRYQRAIKFVEMIRNENFAELGLKLDKNMCEVKTKKLDEPSITWKGKDKSLLEYRRHQIPNIEPLILGQEKWAFVYRAKNFNFAE